VADAISNSGPQQARDLLACVKAMVDLERIGDLAQSFVSRAVALRGRIGTEDNNMLLKMCMALQVMLRDGARSIRESKSRNSAHDYSCRSRTRPAPEFDRAPSHRAGAR
jgi:phosphate uptake regulator